MLEADECPKSFANSSEGVGVLTDQAPNRTSSQKQSNGEETNVEGGLERFPLRRYAGTSAEMAALGGFLHLLGIGSPGSTRLNRSYAPKPLDHLPHQAPSLWQPAQRWRTTGQRWSSS